METTVKDKSVRISKDHGRKLDLICETEGRMKYRHVEILIDADFAARELSLEDDAESSGNGKSTD